ncbi:MAG: hypothetical protein WAW61_09575 [Methylococcaceae bacterium]
METNKTDQKQLTVDFSHRITPLSNDKFVSLEDTVYTMANQATAVLNVLSDQFITIDGESQNRASDNIIFWTIEAAIKEIEDIKQVIRAYRKADLEDNKDQA